MHDLFPFHVVVGEQLDILRFGKKLPLLLPDLRPGMSLTEAFDIDRPAGPPTIQNFQAARRQQFLLKTKTDPATRLRGQFYQDGDNGPAYLILCPFITSNKELLESGLSLSDLPLYDSMEDTLLLLQAKASALEETRTLAKQIEKKGARFRSLIHSSHDIIMTLDASLRISYASPATESILGKASLLLLGQPFLSIVLDEEQDSIRTLFSEQLREHAASTSFQFSVFHPEQGIRMLSATVTNACQSPEVEGYILNITDSTELITLQHNLAQSKRMGSLERMAGGFAHEFNNLLSIILNYATFVDHAIPSEQTSLHDDLSQIILAARRGSELTQRVLHFTRKSVTDMTRLSLTDFVVEMERKLLELTPDSITLTFDYSETDLFIMGCKEQLERVVLNLTMNAIESIMEPEGRIQLAVTRRSLRHSVPDVEGNNLPFGTYHVLSVKDSGCGIPFEDQASLFEPFFTKGKAKHGRGLGLSTVFGIIHQHHANIVLSSRPRQGSEFQIFFQPAFAPEPSSISMQESRLPPPASIHVVVIDDEPSLCGLMHRLLENRGYRVEAFTDPIRALQFIEQEQPAPSLIITDVVMPTLSGPKLAAQVKQTHPHLPILFVSGFTEDEIEEHEGFSPQFFLPKPFAGEALQNAIAKVFQQQSPPASPDTCPE